MLRSDIWVSAFVRRHNNIGHVCVVSRRGDPTAGQVFVELDHLNGLMSLYVPATAASRIDRMDERLFELRFDHVTPDKLRERLLREADFDPDFWLVSLEMRQGDPGLDLVG